MTFQLTTGCSHFCRRCNEWALAGVRSHFSLDAIHRIIDAMVALENDEISLYGASDPLDWEENGNDISTIIEHIKTLDIEYSLLSKVPKGKKTVLERLLKHKANLSISVTVKNKKRIGKIEQRLNTPLFKQHDSEDLLIPAGLDEDFTTVKPSITDGYGTEITPDGAFIITPTFTSALSPFGHKKIAVTAETAFFPIKKTGRHALLIDYFKPLKGYNLNNEIVWLDGLLEGQVESIILDSGEDHLTPPGMRSLEEYLSIFDEPGRIQRKKMTPSIFKKLKQHYLTHTRFKSLSTVVKLEYLEKIKSHQAQCDRAECQVARRSAISFFLEQIDLYLKNNPTQYTILRHLLKPEMEKQVSVFDFENASFKKLFHHPDANNFTIFRQCIFRLFNRKKRTLVQSFFEAYPSEYDPVADTFTPRKPC